MRISDRSLADSIRMSITSANQRLALVQSQLATGRRVRQPSDDPAATATLLQLSSAVAGDTQASQSAAAVKARLSAADSALSSVDDLLQRARELGVQARSGTLSTSDQRAIGTELNQLLLQGVQSANSTFAGQYLFAGSKTTAPPFAAAGAVPAAVAYNGDDVPISVQVQPGSSIRVDVAGDQTLAPAFGALVQMRNAVNVGNSSAIGTALDALDTAMNSVNQARADVGARLNRSDADATSVGAESTQLQARESSLADVDIAGAVVQLNVAQNAYQASLGAAAKLLQTSLLDFLR